MKKYIKPEILVYNIETENLMDASIGLGDKNGLGNTFYKEGEQYSKGHKSDVWGFDEEDED